MRWTRIWLLCCAAAAGATDSPPWATEVDEVFADYDSTRSPGCALGVMRAGELVYGRGYGMANLEHGVPIGSDTVFRIASTSKQFTAMAILLLEKEGRLALDDDVRKHLPELPETEPPITLRHLLHHTSGIRDYLALNWLAGLRDADVYTDDDVLGLLSRQRATDFPPGSRHSYSNSGYFLLSQVVLRVAGKPLREYAAEAIFSPLGMADSHFHDDHTHLVPHRAAGYAPREEGGFAISQTHLEMVGDGGVFTAVEDLARWDANFFEPRVGGREVLARMLTPGVLSDGETLDYALGLLIADYRGLPAVSHGGSFVGYRAQIIRFPGERTSIAVLCNLASASPTRLAHAVADLVLADSFPPAVETAGAGEAAVERVPATPAELRRWSGAYQHVERRFVARVELEADGLTAAFPWGERVELAPLGAGRFAEREEKHGTEFEFSATGFTLHYDGGRNPAEYRRVELESADRDLSQYAGRYYSAEVDTEYELFVADGALRLRNTDARRTVPVDAPLEPTLADAFQLGALPVEFLRRDGEITGFHLSAGRVRNLLFERR